MTKLIESGGGGREQEMLIGFTLSPCRQEIPFILWLNIGNARHAKVHWVGQVEGRVVKREKDTTTPGPQMYATQIRRETYSLSHGYMCNSCMQFLQRSAILAGNSKVMHAKIAHVTIALGALLLKPAKTTKKSQRLCWWQTIRNHRQERPQTVGLKRKQSAADWEFCRSRAERYTNTKSTKMILQYKLVLYLPPLATNGNLGCPNFEDWRWTRRSKMLSIENNGPHAPIQLLNKP